MFAGFSFGLLSVFLIGLIIMLANALVTVLIEYGFE